MMFSSEDSPPSSSKENHLLKPCVTIADESEAPQNQPSPSSPDLKTLSSSVSFNGWRHANKNFKSWARKMAALHESIWRKVGIFEAVMASTYRMYKNTDLILGIAEKWCPETKTFIFPWGETTITLEDVMVLLGFSVLGSPVFATLDSSGEKIMEKLEKEWLKIKEAKSQFVTKIAWMRRFMDSGNELEHVAFLVLWLSYFVFPSRYYHLCEEILPIAVHLSSGTRIALAPAVLAHLYGELSLLKTHIRAFNESSTNMEEIQLSSLFKLVQVWTWERFREIRPKPNPLLKDEPRLARWSGLQQKTSCVNHVLDNSKIDSFEWRPYTKTVKNWEFPKFYPEKAMWVPVDPNLDDEFLSFDRCIKVSELVGIYNVEDYFPNRVASQFGLIQDAPCPGNKNSLSREEAWTDYNKPIDDLTIYIPSRLEMSRVTPTFCDRWTESFPGFKYSSKEKDVIESAETLKARNSTGDDTSFVPSGSNMNRTSKENNTISEDTTNKRRMYIQKARSKMNRTSKYRMKTAEDLGQRLRCIRQARDKRLKYLKQARENGSTIYRTSKDGGKKIIERINKKCKHMKQACDKRRKGVKRARETDESSTIGQGQTPAPSYYDDEDDSLTIGQYLRLNKKYSDVKNSAGDASESLGKKSRTEEDNNALRSFQKFSSTRDDGDETVPPPETEQRNQESDENNTSDRPFGVDEGTVNIGVLPPEARKTCDDELGVHGSNTDVINDANKEPKCLLQEVGVVTGEKQALDEKLCIETEKENNVSLRYKRFAIDELNLEADNNEPSPHQDIAVGDRTQGDSGKDSNEKRLQKLKMLALSLEKRIIKAERTVAWLKRRKAIKQRKIAPAR